MQPTKVPKTLYRGIRFSSPLEARWAVFFDTLKVEFVYEKQRFDLSAAGLFTPDFWLPTVMLRSNSTIGLWAEVAPEYPPESEESKYHALANATRKHLVLLCGENVANGRIGTQQRKHEAVKRATGKPFVPKEPEYGMDGEFFEYMIDEGWDNGMLFLQCTDVLCGHLRIEYQESSYRICPKCGKDAIGQTPAIQEAITAAHSAQFEQEYARSINESTSADAVGVILDRYLGSAAGQTVVHSAPSRHSAVDAYIAEGREMGRSITRTDIWRKAGYKTRTEFERWQRNDPKNPNKAAAERFDRILKEKPHLK